MDTIILIARWLVLLTIMSTIMPGIFWRKSIPSEGGGMG